MKVKPFQLLTRNQIDSIHKASLEVIEDVGLIIRSDEALRVLADGGADVDFKEQRVKASSNLIEEGIKKIPRNVTLYARDPKMDLPMEEGRVYVRPSGECWRVIDPETGMAREAVMKDVERLVALYDALDNVHIITPCLLPSDAPTAKKDIYAAECALRNSRKHLYCTSYNSANLDYIIQMASAIVGDIEQLRKRPILNIYITPERALYLTETGKMLVKAAKNRIPVSFVPTYAYGGNSPITLAGVLVQSNAEILFGNLVAQLINPRNPVIYSTRPWGMNMRTGASCIASIESGLMMAGAVQMAKHYGMPSDAYGLVSDSKILDEQCALEKAMQTTLAILMSPNILCGIGVLESDNTQSFEQTLIDNEIIEAAFRIIEGIDVNDETLAVEAIARTGPGGYYLKDEHTRRFFSREHYIPKLIDRNTRDKWEKTGAKSIVEVARKRVKTILAEHKPVPLDDETIKEFDKILKDAEKLTVKT